MTNEARCRSCPPGGQCRSCRRRRVGGLAGEDMNTMKTAQDFVTGAVTAYQSQPSSSCDSSSSSSSYSSDSGSSSCGGDF